MAPVLYFTPYSRPVRATLMTIKALEIDIVLKEVSLIKRQQLSSDFIKLNPQHTVPTLVEDDGFVLWDSHAIMSYLVDRYGANDSLYPRDVKKRALVNQRLYFEAGTLSAIRIVEPIFYNGAQSAPRSDIEKVIEAYGYLENFLDGQLWVAGNDVTIADLSLLPTVTSMDLLVPVEPKTHPNIVAWIKRSEKLPCYDINKQGLVLFKKMLDKILGPRRRELFSHI